MTALGPCPDDPDYINFHAMQRDWWRTAAQEALKYAQHKGFCQWETGVMRVHGDTCTCGLTEIRRRAEEAGK